MRVEIRMRPEYGVTLDGIWITCDFLEELSAQEPYQSQFGSVLLAPRDVEEACVRHELAVKETRGGVHRGPRLQEFMQALTWPGRRDE